MIIVGGDFGGLSAAQPLKSDLFDVTLIDRRNYGHLAGEIKVGKTIDKGSARGDDLPSSKVLIVIAVFFLSAKPRIHHYESSPTPIVPLSASERQSEWAPMGSGLQRDKSPVEL